MGLLHTLLQKSEVGVDHLFITYPKAKRFWDFFIPSSKGLWFCLNSTKEASVEDLVTSPHFMKPNGSMGASPRRLCGALE